MQRLDCSDLKSEICYRNIEILLGMACHHYISLDVGFLHTYHPSYLDRVWIVVYIVNDPGNWTMDDLHKLVPTELGRLDIRLFTDEFTKNQIIASHNGHLVSSWKAVQKLDFDLKEKLLAVV